MIQTLVVLDGYMIDYIFEIRDEQMWSRLRVDPAVEYEGLSPRQWNSLAVVAAQVTRTQPVVRVGGSGGNTARVYSRLGGQVYLHGQVGDDEESHLVIDAFHRDFCHVSLYRSAGATGRTLIFVRPGGQRIMRSDVGVVMQYNRMDTIRAAMKQGAWLHLTGYLLDPQFPIHRVAWVTMDASSSRSVPVSMDIGSGAYLGRELLRDVVAKYLTVIFLNHTEAKDLGFPSAQCAAEELIGWVKGRRDAIVVITQGKDDVVVRRGGKTIFVPTQQVHVRDTTGAGDSFAAGFLYALSKSVPLEECAMLGCSEAAKTIQVLGGVPDYHQ